MDRKELETYQVQLQQAEDALAADPTNESLIALRDEINELIALTEAALAQAESSRQAATASSSSASRNKNGASTAVPAFSAGDECLAKYSGDNAWYPARVISVGGSAENRVYTVVFKGYDSTELIMSSAIKPLPPSHQNNNYTAPAKRKLTKDEEDERERKKKKNEKKLETRAAKAKEQVAKQQTWQKFAKKSEKKGIVLPGVAGTSIFKTPDNPLGRVGVTGSGKGMTEYAQRGKHKFSATED